MRDPWLCVDLAVFDEADDALEVFGQGVARTEQAALRFMEDWMAKTDLVGRDADEDQPAAVGDLAESVRHRHVAAGRIDYHVREMAVGHGAQIVFRRYPSA